MTLNYISTLPSSKYLPVNAGHTGNILLVADPLRQQPVSDLPGEHGGVIFLVLRNGLHYARRGYLGFAPSNDARLEVACLVISGEYLGDTAMRYSELSADITRSHSLVSKFHDPLSHHVRKGAAVDKKPSELVDSSMSCKDLN